MPVHESTTPDCLRHDAPRRYRPERGAILLEVIVALGLLIVTATVMLGSMSTAARAVKRLRLDNQAADLAVTLLSEIQMGLVEIVQDGPNEYPEEHLEDWTWELAVSSVDQSVLEEAEFTKIEIIIANDSAGFKHRLIRLLPEPELDWAEALEDTFESEGTFEDNSFDGGESPGGEGGRSGRSMRDTPSMRDTRSRRDRPTRRNK